MAKVDSDELGPRQSYVAILNDRRRLKDHGIRSGGATHPSWVSRRGSGDSAAGRRATRGQVRATQRPAGDGRGEMATHGLVSWNTTEDS